MFGAYCSFNDRLSRIFVDNKIFILRVIADIAIFVIIHNLLKFPVNLLHCLQLPFQAKVYWHKTFMSHNSIEFL